MNGIASRTGKRVARRTALATAVLLLFGAANGATLAEEGASPAQDRVMLLQTGFAPYPSLSDAELRKYRGGDLANQSLTQVTAPRETMVAVQLWDELQKTKQASRGIAGGNASVARIPGQISSSDKVSGQVYMMQNLIPIVPQKIAR